jgi:hypothetical protein
MYESNHEDMGGSRKPSWSRLLDLTRWSLSTNETKKTAMVVMMRLIVIINWLHLLMISIPIEIPFHPLSSIFIYKEPFSDLPPLSMGIASSQPARVKPYYGPDKRWASPRFSSSQSRPNRDMFREAWWTRRPFSGESNWQRIDREAEESIRSMQKRHAYWDRKWEQRHARMDTSDARKKAPQKAEMSRSYVPRRRYDNFYVGAVNWSFRPW